MRSPRAVARRQVWNRLAPALVTHAYRGILGREPDREGLAYGVRLLRGGVSYSRYLQDLVESEEFKTLGSRPPSLVQLHADVVLRLAPPFQELRFCGPVGDTSIFASILESGGVWEPHVTTLLSHILEPGDTFIDAGANLGYFSVIAAHLVGAEGHVWAFEPLPSVRDYCVENVRLNDLDNVSVMPLALWDSERTMKMLDPAGQRAFLGGAHLLADGTTATGGTPEAEVSCAALDHLIATTEPAPQACNVIKMDIEGAEPAALRGMREFLDRTRPVLCVELNSHCLEALGSSAAELLELLETQDYAVFALPKAEQAEHLHRFPEVSPWPDVSIRDVSDRDAFLSAARQMDRNSPPAEPVDLVARPRERAWQTGAKTEV